MLLSIFTVYFYLGFTHLTDIGAYDHFLFLLCMVVAHSWQEWRRLLWLVTAFTIGHSLTLALVVLGVIGPSQDLVEFLVAFTIVFSALLNLRWVKQSAQKSNLSLLYGLALVFGLIHGMAFSNFLRSSLAPWEEQSAIVGQLLSFNVGVEIGQIFLVAIIIGLGELIVRWKLLSRTHWIIFASGAAFGLALVMMLERIGPLLYGTG